MSGGDLATAAWERVDAAVDAAPAGPTRDLLALMRLATRVRLGDDDAVGALAALPLDRRFAALELICANVPATEATAAIGRDSVFRVDRHDLLSDRVIAAWAGLSLAQARWGETNSYDRIRALGRLIGGGTPPDVAGMMALLDQLEHPVEIEAAVVSWFTERPFDGRAETLALLERAERPGTRLEAIGAVLAKRDVSATQAEAWLATAEAAISGAPVGSAALHRARRAGLWRVAGRADEALGELRAALDALQGESDPEAAARLWRAALTAASVVGFQAWEDAARRLTRARVFLRDQGALLSARAHAVRTLPRAARSAAEVDRGHHTLIELSRRLPSRWLALQHRAVVARLIAEVGGRSPTAQLSQLEAWLRADGLPRPIAAIAVEEVVAPLAAVDAERALAFADLLPSPMQRALWAVAWLTTSADQPG